jgi:NhaC family Na+:H+ antiporter
MVGALAGTWLVSGIIPSMIYYGLQILSPAIFCQPPIICSIFHRDRKFWTTSATVGIALIGAGRIGFDWEWLLKRRNENAQRQPNKLSLSR